MKQNNRDNTYVPLLLTGEAGRSNPDPPGFRPIHPEQIGAGATPDAFSHLRHVGQVPEPGITGGSHQGPPDNVPDGR